MTIVGNALNAPELRRTTGTNTLVASFRVASTSRRYDRDSGRWVDGPSLRVRVTCWRRLAEGVTHSVVTGDPLVVTGRMYTRDWIGDDGQQRVSYELEAIAVGHDLSRGFADFRRHRPGAATSMVEDAESDARIAGQVSVPVGAPATDPSRRGGPADPSRRGDLDELSPSDAPTPTFDPPSTPLASPYGGTPLASSYGGTPLASPYGGYGPARPTGDEPAGDSTDDERDDGRSDDDAVDDALKMLRAVGLGTDLAVDASGADPDGGDPDGDDDAEADGTADDAPEVARPARRRSRTRVPVPA
ncbi:single-stranded DNA-binding protein [Planosporangium sp. 12N6]|uniref:single-stranded DNA-binding protein n=1 Tax=Planosporangium spinosum TaxID=3402278 RepID=UPI003CEAF38B